MTEEISRFVYIYSKAESNVIIYVGRGTAERITDHGLEDSNLSLADALNEEMYSIEVMECPNEVTAKYVEGALISALLGRNKVQLRNKRLDKYSFVPLGVPHHLAERRTEPPITPQELAQKVAGRVLLVRIGPRDLSDPTRGRINPALIDDGAVIDRIRKEWKISGFVRRWVEMPNEAPIVLVGVAGKKHRYVIGAMDLRKVDWNQVEVDGSFVAIPEPTQSESDQDDPLDALGLRGLTLKEAKIFSQTSLAVVYDANGQVPKPN